MSESKGERDETGRRRKTEWREREWAVATWHVWPWGSEAKREWGREWEKEMEGDGERPAMSSLTVHCAAHVSTLHPSSGSNARAHTDTWREPPNGLLHSPFPYKPRLPTLLMHLSHLYARSFSCCSCYNRDREGMVCRGFWKHIWQYSCRPTLAISQHDIWTLVVWGKCTVHLNNYYSSY